MANFSRVGTAFSTAIIIAVAAATTAVETVTWLWRAATTWLTEAVVAVSAKLPRIDHGWQLVTVLQVQMVRAKAFVMRQLSRDMPRLTPGWRLCPSI